jgi:phosphonate transport system substrate-binding protein
MRTVSFKICALLLFLIALFLFIPGTVAAQETVILGIHPYLPSTELVKRFTPVAKSLGEETGKTFVVYISKDYEDHIARTGKNEFHIAYMGPAGYVKMVERYGNKPLIARLEVNGTPTFQGCIVVKNDSSLRSLKELSGKRFAFGDIQSTMSHLVPRYMLMQEGVRVDDLSYHRFLNNHHNVALGVLSGDFDAGAVKEEVFHEYEKRGLMSIERTPAISEHVFVASGRIPQKTVEALRKALFRLRDEEQNRAVMTSIKKTITGFVPARDSDYNNLRRILKELGEKEKK